MKKASQSWRSYNKIKKLSVDPFCAGDVQTIDYCLKVYRQYVTNESFDLFYIMTGKLNKPYQNYINN